MIYIGQVDLGRFYGVGDIKMLGFDVHVYRNASTQDQYPHVVMGGKILYISPMQKNRIPNIYDLYDLAVEVIREDGYPSVFKARAGNLPWRFENVSDDEILVVEMWDQS